MKKFLCLLLCCFMILAFSGCKKQIKIAVPADVTNQARALMLLEKEGLIKLNEGIDINATVDDIKENPYNIDFVKLLHLFFLIYQLIRYYNVLATFQ